VNFSCEKKKILCRLEDEETGQIPMAYVVRAAGSELSEDQIIQFVAGQVTSIFCTHFNYLLIFT